MLKIDLELLEKEIKKDLETADAAADFDQLYYKYLGSKGKIRALFQKIKGLPEKEKKEMGLKANDLQKRINRLFDLKKNELVRGQTGQNMKADAKAFPLGCNLPKIGHLHPITQTIRRLNKVFMEMGYSIVEGPEIETDEYNFRRVNVPKDHPARDMQDTIYIKEPELLLRTHTSSVEARILADFKPPMKFVCPGKVYRNEKVNKSNHFIFHQYQGVVVLKQVSLKDLFSTFNILFKKLYGPKTVVRYRNKYYPEVEPGVGADIQCFNCQGKGCALCKGVGWIEMGGAGITHPDVLKMAGIDPKKWLSFAFGLGLDRWVMAKYNITDIRTLLGGNLAYKYNENENSF